MVSILLNYFPTIADNLQLYATSIEINQENITSPEIVDFLLSTLQLLDQFIRLFSIHQSKTNHLIPMDHRTLIHRI